MQVRSINSDLGNNNVRYNRQAGQNVAFGTILKNNLPKILHAGEDGRIKEGFLCVVSGPSGVGKDSILELFDRRYGFFSRIVTCTTREMRPGEVNGKSYHFLTPDTFKRGIENDEFLEYNNKFGERFYGVRTKDVKEAIATGNNIVLSIDPQGAMKVKKQIPGAILFFITPPSISELFARLNKRGTESAAAIMERVGRAVEELKFKDKYDVILQNDNLSESVDEMARIFNIKA